MSRSKSVTDRPTVIAVDFDGTVILEGSFPLGSLVLPIPHCVRVLQAIKNHSIKLILLTCREDDALKQAVQWFKNNDIELDAVNESITFYGKGEHFKPGRKVFADLYIDDRGLGIPKTKSGVVSWKKIGNWLIKKGYIRYY